MQIHAIIILLLLVLFSSHLYAYSNDSILRDTIIAHPETGVFLNYIGTYRPSERIVHASAIFPMTTATCHFLPLSASEKIPSCSVTARRNKRVVGIVAGIVGGVIGVCAAFAGLGMSIANTIQNENLQEQIALMDTSLTKFSKMLDIHQGQLAKITAKHIELTDQLQVTQKAINDIVPVISAHSTAIDSLRTDVEQLKFRMQNSFLHLGISQISRNELTLAFLSPEDIHKVVHRVIKEGNLTFNSYHGSLPVVQIVTKLLVRQQIDFVPRSLYTPIDREEIGRLVITSFFAVPQYKHAPFYVYKLVTVPLLQENGAVQLAELPKYWAINPARNLTIEWNNPEESRCDLGLMTSCRDTPPFRKISKDTCIDQIMKKVSLSKCHITSIPTSEYFLRRLKDNLWVTSSLKPMRCVKIPHTEYQNKTKQSWNTSEEIILPPVSLVNVTEGYIIEGPEFIMEGQPLSSNAPSLVILYNSGGIANNISVMNVHDYMTENMTWFKKNVAEQDRRTLMDFIKEANAVSTYHTPFSSSRRSFISSFIPSFGMFTFNWIIYGCLGILLYLSLIHI